MTKNATDEQIRYAAPRQSSMNLQQLVDADLMPLKLILDIVPPLLRKRAADAMAIGDQPGADAYLQALGRGHQDGLELGEASTWIRICPWSGGSAFLNERCAAD